MRQMNGNDLQNLMNDMIRTERVRGEADVAILEVADNGPEVPEDQWKNAIFVFILL